jgi:hypothetical protein
VGCDDRVFFACHQQQAARDAGSAAPAGSAVAGAGVGESKDDADDESKASAAAAAVADASDASAADASIPDWHCQVGEAGWKWEGEGAAVAYATCGVGEGLGALGGGGGMATRSWGVGPWTPRVECVDRGVVCVCLQYELRGVLAHTGTADSGHYYSFIKVRPTPQKRGGGEGAHLWLVCLRASYRYVRGEAWGGGSQAALCGEHAFPLPGRGFPLRGHLPRLPARLPVLHPGVAGATPA